MPVSKKIIRTLIRFYAVIAVAAFMGCVLVGPDYAPPGTTVSGSWHAQLGSGLRHGETDPVKLAQWWTALNDPELTVLINRAAAGNLDLKQAKARLREARARRFIAGADQFPTLDATGTATRSRSSENAGSGTTHTLYSAGFDAGWEIDVFGGVRRSVEAAEADLAASQEDLHGVMVSLMAEVALNYIEVRTYQGRLATAQANLRNQEETYQLTQWRFKAGLSDELDVHQARSALESTRARIPTLRTSLEEAKNRLTVLMGVQPGELHGELEAIRPVPVVPLEVAVRVPADVLRQRPDVRKAERELAAQTARVGVATADLYPKLTLNGSIGFDALSTGDLLTADSRSYSYGPRISWRIFDAGAVRRNIEVQSAKQEQALVTYESTVLSALEETENALVAYAEEQHRRDSLLEAVRAAQQVLDLAQSKYQAGLIDFIALLDAQRSLLSYQDELGISDGAVTSNLVRLYKALGGGWDIQMRAKETN
ncbi:MAG: efflux transporter outer membrane subunit [Pseudomonadota bacterium]